MNSKNVRKNKLPWNQESIPRIRAFLLVGKNANRHCSNAESSRPGFASTRACNKNVNKKCTSTNY